MAPAKKTLKAHLDEARRQYFAKLRPAEPWTKQPERQENEVAVYYKICKYLPFEVTNKRVKGWEHVRTLPDGGRIETRAHETITPGDIFVLISAIKVFQDNINNIVPSVVESKEMLTVSINYTEFAKKYIRSHDKGKLLKTLKRLYSYHAFWHTPEGEVTAQRYLYDFDLDTGHKNLTLTISKAFAELCNSYGWLINFKQLQDINSPTARTLFLYLSTNTGCEYRQETIEHWLDMKQGTSGTVRDNKKQIKKAFDELQTAEVIKSYTITGKGNFQIIHSDKKSSPVTAEMVPCDRTGNLELPAETVKT
jgi:hypothetical protein